MQPLEIDAGLDERRLSICYIAPGQNLLDTAGPTRNVLNLATALSRHADVTVAFRRVLDRRVRTGLKVLEIDPSEAGTLALPDDSAVRGVGLGRFARYVLAVRRFAARELGGFDLVLEKSWTLSGLVAVECGKQGVPCVVIENLVPGLAHGAEGHAGLLKRIKLWSGRALAGRYLRRADQIIAETPILKAAMVSQWRIEESHISVVPLGVDRQLFRPLDQAAARHALGVRADATVLLYSGIVDRTHNLRPVVRAMSLVKPPGTELHIIGDGALRQELALHVEQSGASVRFHGRVPYERVPDFIAAADLCLAPYDPGAFAGGEVAYSSLKIPEYMSAGRAVASVPSGRVLDLVEDGVNGFLFANTLDEWCTFLGSLPERDQLRRLGETASRGEFDSWNDVAQAYLRVGRAEIRRRGHHGKCRGSLAFDPSVPDGVND